MKNKLEGLSMKIGNSSNNDGIKGCLVAYIKQTGRWTCIHQYLIDNEGYKVELEHREICKKRKLTDTDLCLLALVICYDFFDKKSVHTIRSLAIKMDGSTDKTIAAASRRIKRMIDDVEDYKIFNMGEGVKEGKKCYYITPTEALLGFIETTFFNINEYKES